VPNRLFMVSASGVLVVDAVLGAGIHRIASHLHLHPELPAGAAHARALGASAERRAVPYHERFNETREMTELFVECEAALPWAGGWWIGAAPLGEPAPSLRLEAAVVELRVDAGGPLELRWDLAGGPGSVSIRC